MSKYTHLVTSGCSFSDNVGERWPHYLAQRLNAKLFNRGHGSAGNDWISRSTIFQISELLNLGVQPSKILAVVMWSGIDRASIFISNKETRHYDSLINSDNGSCNPINFIYHDHSVTPKNSDKISSGYLIGSMGCTFENDNITRLKQEYVLRFLNNEALAINSIHNWLELQWFCRATGVNLVNQTYMNIWHYPYYPYDIRDNMNILDCIYTHENYKDNIHHLYNLLDLSTWVFYRDFDGLYEYTKFNNLEFYDDNLHPLPETHKHYVDNFLCKKIEF